MPSYFASESAQDQWSIGVAYGCYQVHQAHQPYPVLLAFWVRKALKRIEERELPVSPKVIRFCEKWCQEAEQQLTQCHCKCHGSGAQRRRVQPRRKQQRWRSSS